MLIKFFAYFFIIGILNTSLVRAYEFPSEGELLVCQDQAESFGNGKGDDHISSKCISHFKMMSINSNAMKESFLVKMKVYGYRNMIFLEKNIEGKVTQEIIAGSSTELNSIQTLAIDEKNKEIAVLEENGNILFFSSKITGNIAPYRVIKHKELEGANDIVVDSERDFVIVNNNKNKRILFFSRLADINGRRKNQSLDIKKSINTSSVEVKNLFLDSQKSELLGFDAMKSKNIVFDLKKLSN